VSYIQLELFYGQSSQVQTISPLLGPTSGGTKVYFVGQNLNNHSACLFGDTEVIAQFVSSSMVVCTSPQVSLPDLVALSLVDIVTNITITLNIFEYYLTPTLYGIYPSEGPLSGNFEVKVFGSLFLNITNITCSFGNNTVNALYFSDTIVTCVVPASSSAGSVLVKVSLNGQQPSVGDVYLTYSKSLEKVEEIVDKPLGSHKSGEMKIVD